MGIINDPRMMIPISGLTENELAEVFENIGFGPFMLLSGSAAHASSPPSSFANTTTAQVFDPGTVRVVDFLGEGRVPPNARVLAQIVQQAMNEFASSPTSVQHYLSPGSNRAYRNNTTRLGPVFTGIAVENYTAAYVNSVPGLQRRITNMGGPNAPDNIIAMGSRPSQAYGFTDTHPRGTEWGRVHEVRFYLKEGRTGVPAFGIQYQPFPSAFHIEATSRIAPNYVPRWQNQIRTGRIVRRPPRTK